MTAERRRISRSSTVIDRSGPKHSTHPFGVRRSCKHANPGCRTKRSTRGLCPFSPPGCHAGGVVWKFAPSTRFLRTRGKSFSDEKRTPKRVRGVSLLLDVRSRAFRIVIFDGSGHTPPLQRTI